MNMLHRLPLLRTLILGPITLLGLAAQIPAQEPDTSVATAKFRKAWWEETGRGALSTALSIYLSAADAEGPEITRARALLRAGTLQRQLGDETGAIESLRRLIETYPGEAELVVQARQRLTAMQGIDQRVNSMEMHHRYLFSEAAQAKVQELIIKLAALYPLSGAPKTKIDAMHGLENSLLAYGIGAVPALQAAARGAQPELALSATLLLLRLGELPPTNALFQYPYKRLSPPHKRWSSKSWAWENILSFDPSLRKQLHDKLGNRRSAIARTLRLATSGPQALLQAIGTDLGGELGVEDYRAIGAIVQALLKLDDKGLNTELFELAVTETTPLVVRRELEDQISDQNPSVRTAGEWLAWSVHPIHVKPRIYAFRNAVSQLRRGDGKVLDMILKLVHPASERSTPMDLLYALRDGFDECPVPLQVPWTSARFRTALEACMQASTEDDAPLGRYYQRLRMSTAHCDALAAAIFDNLISFRDIAEKAQEWKIGNHIRTEDDHEEERPIERRWNQAVIRQLKTQWRDWSEKDRLAAIYLIHHSAVVLRHSEIPSHEVAKVLKQLSSQEGTSQAVRDAQQAFFDALEQ